MRTACSARSRQSRMRVSALALACCGLVGPAGAGPPQGPGAGPWRKESPEAHGLKLERVHAAAAHVFGSREAATRDCLVMVKDGALVYESYSSWLYNVSAHPGNSVTKTLGGLLMGWAQTRGLLDIDADITKAYGVPSPRPYPVTSRQLMSQALAGENAPGEAWRYDAGGTFWLSSLPQVFAKATGRSPSEVWREEFAKPLGVSQAFQWDSADLSWAAGSAATCRDYARVGQLMLNGGRWPGVEEPLVSEDFVQQMHTPQKYAPYTNYSNPCYGLLTWLNTNPNSNTGSDRYPGTCHFWPKECWLPAGSASNVYVASGVMGQTVMVVPDHNLVVVSMGTTPDDNPVMRVMYEGVCMMFPGECPDTVETAPYFAV